MPDEEWQQLAASAGAFRGRLPSAVRFGAYLLTAKVASDRVATCLRAQHLDREQQSEEVLVRVLHDHLAEDPRHREQFLAEGRAGMALGNAADIVVLEVGESDGMCFWAVDLEAGMRRALAPQARPEWRPLERWLPIA